jgi:hypothetical protein
VAAVSVLAALQPSLDVDGQVVANLIGVAGLEDPEESAVGTALLDLLLLLVVAAFVSPMIRFRRSRGEERQQLKWFTYAGALVPLVALGDVLPVAFSNLFSRP